MTKSAERPWIDCLWEKHECYDYTPRIETVALDGRTIRLLLPSYMPRFTVLAWAEQGALLFLLLQLDQRYDDAFVGAVVLARKTEENSYTTTIWHELYPYALKSLGFAGEDQ
ncbi:MAG: hypothetical protein M5U01_19220 [Ardenticatenaceae bacterium]|nr:hypothetical protein [Ardenticatenaceae bacterium]